VFLSPEEVVTLTGYKRPADQARWLKAEGIRHRLNGANRVVVLRSDLDRSAPRTNAPRLALIR
jgi:hypothetical protein